MKQSVRLALAISVLMLIFLSCKKKNDAAPVPVSYFMTASLGGNIWTAKTVGGSADSSTITIEGKSNDSSRISINIPLNIKPDTNVVKYVRSMFYYTTKAENIGAFTSFAITSNTGNMISGTFTATIYNRWGQLLMQLTNGSFRVKY